MPRLSLFLTLRRTLLTLMALVAASGCSQQQATQQEVSAKRHSMSSGQSGYCPISYRHTAKPKPDVWAGLVSRYQMPLPSNERIDKERDWFLRNPNYMNRVGARSDRYLYFIAEKLKERNLPGELALLPIVESAYNPFALSRSQAAGLWQFIPSTGRFLKMEINDVYDARRDIITSTETALDYLVFLRDHYQGDWHKALAAYNAGWGTIDRAVAKNRAAGKPTDYWSLDVPAETRAYVPKFLALVQLSKQPQKYRYNWPYTPNYPYFSTVKLPHNIDINYAADLAGIDVDEIHRLNPGLGKHFTPPGGPHRLLLPIDQANGFSEQLAQLTYQRRVPRAQAHANAPDNALVAAGKARNQARVNAPAGSRPYKIKSGDTLFKIAAREGVDMEEIRRINNMAAGDPVRLGDIIGLPLRGQVRPAPAATQSRSTAISRQAAASTKTRLHTVRAGETLMAISRKHQVNPHELARINGFNLQNAHLTIGQQLIIPAR